MGANDVETRTSKLTEESEKIMPSPDVDNRFTDKEKCRPMTEHTKKTLISVVIVFLLAFSWVGAQQYVMSSVQLYSFSVVYFAIWFSICFMTLCFPAYLVFVACAERNKEAFCARAKESRNIFGQHPVTLWEFFTKILFLNVLWLAVSYLYMFGLTITTATIASSIMVSNVAFVYILSLCILFEHLCALRAVAAMFCIGGVVLFEYAEGFHGSADMLKGILLVIVSAFGAAVYKVVFKKVIGAGTLGQVSLFLSLLGLSNLLMMWIVNLPFPLLRWRSFSFSDMPWEPLIFSAILCKIFNFLVNFGIAYTDPLFISIAMVIGIPLNAFVDVLFHGEMFDAIRLVSAAIIFAGFGILLLPNSWNDPIHNLIRCKAKK